MRFKATRNWFLIAFAVGSPYYWIQYAMVNQNDRLIVTLATALTVMAVMLLVFLLRPYYLEVGADRVIMQSPFRKKVWAPSDFSEVSVSEDVISARDEQGRVYHLMLPQKPESFERMKQAVREFCRRHRVPLTDQPLVRR